MSEAQMRSAEEEIEEKEITESKTEEIAEQDGEEYAGRKAGRREEDRIFKQRNTLFQNQYFTEIYGPFHCDTHYSSDRTARCGDFQLKVLGTI